MNNLRQNSKIERTHVQELICCEEIEDQRVATESGTLLDRIRLDLVGPTAQKECRVGAKDVFTVKEIAELFGFSRQTVTRMFENEPGVLVLARPETMHKRSYRSIRIPRAVYERVTRRIEIR